MLEGPPVLAQQGAGGARLASSSRSSVMALPIIEWEGGPGNDRGIVCVVVCGEDLLRGRCGDQRRREQGEQDGAPAAAHPPVDVTHRVPPGGAE